MARKPKSPPATWKVGKFTATYENGEYFLRSGNSLIMRTASEERFKEICELVEGRN